EETVTVSGESPVVDVQSNSKAQVLPREVLDAVPTAHTIQGVGQLVVGVTLTAPDVGGSAAMQQTYFTVHGLGAAQTSVLMDGMIINGLQGDGAIQSYLNDAGNQEMVYQTGGGTVDSPTGGVKINLVPKEGGNRFSGSFFGGYGSYSQNPRRSDGSGRRPDDGGRRLELAVVHDEHGEVDIDRDEQAAPGSWILEQHRAVQQSVSTGHREAVRIRRVAGAGAA